MICPFCHQDTSVYNSRLTSQQQQVWRRRRCKACLRVFTTKERIDWTGAISVTSGDEGSDSAPYSRDRLQLSVATACKPMLIQYGSVSELCDAIEYKLQQEDFFSSASQPASIITTYATAVLRRYNPAFAVAYAQQVYRQNPPLELLQEILESPSR